MMADLTWPEAGEYVAAGVILAVPVGSTEQHGPHLPLSTDTDIALALCTRLAAARADVLVAPAVPYGSSGEHAGFPGTLSIGASALELLIVELCRSATDSFERILLVNGHGGNVEPLRRAVDLLRTESRDVRLFLPRYDGDPHAGRTETALQLALSPGRVRTDRAEAGDVRPLPQILPLLRTGGVRAVSPNGVLGDPTDATAEEGAALLAQLTSQLTDQTRLWWPQTPERIQP
ncbi:mycofactocin biosynthesis peptidyl-dipeptidase MftE [Nocardia cyriacigeorgica]|uniref:Mycofactocin biosynthesis peptidyl-dipeptidase MftE n=1 Tax=Nocardia cyriacigeorgica TaxID=135487 RepID=A0A6P1D5F1_9NOCA|nr:mycofactocin biosynthesis peptidyl-dipeptidase MftE [Nocardia cyriacigeorgica]NEW41997.1 mycofactocin biosynthesis peptidyl-dipeptidase MftE [Nocardia cyriacigeorgica]NEW44779.1 mycofactocin biosynthesis peptidyl-dipeptidase MftE [Nocardia cyriacigeorgica]NEW50475.1 mycofactocin biosynthesis peptidyl-dipeptidase MftE [Nocardia cyriacigeorgica]NEW59342.1 mycofactocin biosynthesis peptidyl-dipeptidase MftE [Nocardia cyriacigeorgica]